MNTARLVWRIVNLLSRSVAVSLSGNRCASQRILQALTSFENRVIQSGPCDTERMYAIAFARALRRPPPQNA
jgi:hypothetical protein